MTRRARWSLAAAALVLLVQAVVAVVAAGPASAHSTLVSTTPAQGSQVPTSPTEISLTFSEDVGVAPDSVRLLDSRGEPVATGPVHRLMGATGGEDGATVAVTPSRPLATGSYAVLWHVVSADSHPVSGAFSFGLGVAAGAVPGDAVLTTSVRLVQVLHWAFVALWFAAAGTLVGASVFLVLLWPQGSTAPRSVRLLQICVVGAGVAAAGLYVVQGAYGLGRGLDALTDLALLRDTLDTPAGPLYLERLLVVAAAGPVLGLWPRRPVDRWPVVALAAVLGLVTALAGHAGQARPLVLAAGADAAHFVAAGVWFGGLVLLLAVFLPTVSLATASAVLPRWSRLAMTAVAVLVVTGTYQAWREVRSTAALTGTDYGRLVIVKVSGLVLLLALGEVGRRWVTRLACADAGATLVGLSQSVYAEVVVGGGVLLVTAALVGTVPARQAYAAPFSGTIAAVGVEGAAISVVVDIPRTQSGAQVVHVYTYTSAGQVLPFTSVEGTLVEKAKKIGPIRFSFVPTGPGHGTAESVVVPSAGTWTLTVQVKTDPATAYAGTATYQVAG